VSEFLNPYQFIRVTGAINGDNAKHRILAKTLADGTTTCPARHDLWQSRSRSGRIICRLHLDTPTVVGAEQVDEPGTLSKRVMPYLRNGQPAVPGSSLRGMVGSLAEALSQSSLRVLENRELVVSRRFTAGKVHDYFGAIDRDLVPWKSRGPRVAHSSDRAGREFLTPAELLFGVVDEREGKDDDDAPPAFHLASRVRFSDALPHPDRPPPLGAKVTLKILASPKGRYPGMYFHPNGKRGQFIPKFEPKHSAFYSDSGRRNPTYVPNGRKVYLHHRAEDVEAEVWVTADPGLDADHQKLRCTPIYNHRYGDNDSDLWFHIDFENLSNAELTLLVASLKPSDEFRHRLGLGKPLGLGTVEIAIEGVFFIDRVARYGRDPLDAPRYHEVWCLAPPGPQIPWAWRYPDEAQRLGEVAAADRSGWWKRDLIDGATLGDVTTLGNPKLVKAPVHTPTLDGLGTEDQTFKWFAENERHTGRRALPNINHDRDLPTLPTYPQPPRDGQGNRGRGRRH
jgi:hypothetical protein